MITINYNLFIQIVYMVWVVGGILALICVPFVNDYKQKTNLLIYGVIMLTVCIACVVF